MEIKVQSQVKISERYAALENDADISMAWEGNRILKLLSKGSG